MLLFFTGIKQIVFPETGKLYTYCVTLGNVLYVRYNANMELKNITITEIIAHLVGMELLLTSETQRALFCQNKTV